MHREHRGDPADRGAGRDHAPGVVEALAKKRKNTRLLEAVPPVRAARHLRPIGETFADPVEVSLSFLQTPYLWGGASGFVSAPLTASSR